uniref:Uncharacterized protein n=1 Tax=Arundo donax TaxID=35708 RepID=A0A0A9HF69_ARUDO
MPLDLQLRSHSRQMHICMTKLNPRLAVRKSQRGRRWGEGHLPAGRSGGRQSSPQARCAISKL